MPTHMRCIGVIVARVVLRFGLSLAKTVARLRLGAARERMGNAREPIEEIAGSKGYGDSERMRRTLVRAFRSPPQVVRQFDP